MNSDELDTRIDAALQGPEWEPPRDFARRVAATAAYPAPRRSVSWGLAPPGVFDAALPGLLVALAGCAVGLMPDVLAADVTLAAWLCAGLTVWTAATFARRASV